MNSAVADSVIKPCRPADLSSRERLTDTASAAPIVPRRFRFRRLLSFVGPGYLVAVGYMDPGNWATSLTAGSTFGYSLLSIVLMSSVMAMLLQAAAVRLGISSGLDLAQACRRYFPAHLSLALWLACEVAIVACNLAEVLGMASGLNLLFHVPLVVGVCVTALDVMLVLRLQRRGARPLEVFIIALVALIGVCVAIQLVWLQAPLGEVAAGFLPTTEIVTRPEMLYLAVGIIGATVMPHNLYLHSALVQARVGDGMREARDESRKAPASARASGLAQTIRYATLDSNLALTLALLVNVGILVLAAAAFHRPGQGLVVEFEDAYRLLSPVLGASAASTLFGVGLIASGLSSSITGTLAGQVVMEGFLDIRVSRAKRALLTRSVAILPAVAVAAWFGHDGVGRLLVLSQVILGLQLPFAVIPLLWFTTRRRHLGAYAFSRSTSVVLWSVAILLTAINAWSVWEVL
jgi:manganese transport protein